MTIKMAYERTIDGFAVGVIYPNGDPWIYTSHATTEEALLIEYRSALGEIQVISIEEHNQLKAEWCEKRKNNG